METAPSMRRRKQIALIAHDNRKADLLEWARYNRGTLSEHELHATGTTGSLLAKELDLPVNRFLSGPLGGDQQVGAAIAEGRIDGRGVQPYGSQGLASARTFARARSRS